MRKVGVEGMEGMDGMEACPPDPDVDCRDGREVRGTGCAVRRPATISQTRRARIATTTMPMMILVRRDIHLSAEHIRNSRRTYT